MTFLATLFLIPIPLSDLGTDPNAGVFATYLNDKVAKARARREQMSGTKSELSIVQARADALVEEANKTARQQELVQDEVNFEADKLKNAEARAEKKAQGAAPAATQNKVRKPRKPRAKKFAGIMPLLPEEPTIPMLEPSIPMLEPSIPMLVPTTPLLIRPKRTKAPLITITTLFFIYSKGEAVGKGKKMRIKKTQHAMMLWDDGPSSRLVTGLPKFCIDEYKNANLRGVDGGCLSCACVGAHDGNQQQFEAHVDWHSKFRLFFPLREHALAGFSNLDPVQADVDHMLAVLTTLWHQVSPAAVYFQTDAFRELCATVAARSAYASTSASTPASTSTSNSASTSTATFASSVSGVETSLAAVVVPEAAVGMRRVRRI
jgi:hypothetical protein